MCKALGYILRIYSMLLVTSQENKQKTKPTNKMGWKVSRSTPIILKFILIFFLEAGPSFMSKFCGYPRELTMVEENSE